MSRMQKITGERRERIISAIKRARLERDRGNGSVWDNLVRILGESEAEIAMMNLMWTDRGFLPARGTNCAK